MKFRANDEQLLLERLPSGLTDAARANPALPSSPADDLRQLMVLRTFALCGQTLAILVASMLDVTLPLVPMVAAIASLVALNAITWIRLRHSAPRKSYEIQAQVVYDLGVFTLLLALSGGSTNPFSLFFVLHVVVAALLLPPLQAGLATLLVVGSFSLVAAFHVPLRLGSGEPLPSSLLTFGQWVSVVLTAIVVAWFLVRIVGALREHHRLLREAAQKALNDETILRLGALAAGAAHELTTPMTTMAIVAGEMHRQANSPSLQSDVAILVSQIDACRQTISNLLAAAGHARAEGGGRERLDLFLEALSNRFQTTHPAVAFTCRWDGVRPVPSIFADQALKQSVLALLDNAADASPNDVRMVARWDQDTLHIAIDDRGGGVAASHLGKLGRAFFTTKPPGKGTGLGLVLAANAIRHLGGSLRWENRTGGGVRAELALPLRALTFAERIDERCSTTCD